MKHKLILALLLALTLSLTACGTGNTSISSNIPTNTISPNETISENTIKNINDETANGFNYNDSHIELVKKYLSNSTFSYTSCNMSQNEFVLVSSDEAIDFKKNIYWNKIDYEGYFKKLTELGYNPESLGESKSENILDINNKIYLEYSYENNKWILNQENQDKINFSSFDNSKSSWDNWVTTMLTSGIFFNAGEWTENNNNTCTYSIEIADNTSSNKKQCTTATFEYQGDGSLKPLSLDLKTITTSTLEGYDIDDNGNISDTLSSKNIATIDNTHFDFCFDSSQKSIIDFPSDYDVEIPLESVSNDTVSNNNEK